MAKCMYCGATLELMDGWCMSDGKSGALEQECLGECPECGKRYQWYEKYKLVSIEGMEEIEKEE